MLWLLLLSSPFALAEFPADTCWTDGEACLVNSDNLLSSIPGVKDLPTCRQLCQDTEGCEYLSYFGQESFPFQDHCVLFSSCEMLHSCQDCRTEELLCFALCGNSVEGPIAGNELAIITEVPSEIDCKFNCSANPDCSIYTYHDSTDPNYPNLCILLTDVMEPLQSCEHCSTGFPDCRNITRGICTFLVETDSPLTFYQFNETGITNVSLVTLGDCELTVVAVGGGGTGRDYYYGGGGSGRVATTTVSGPTSNLVVSVGRAGEESSLRTLNEEILITALPGEDNDGYHGGAGYSGGGGGGSSAYYGDGGQDGGEGCCNGYGGLGSGLNLSSISLQQFSITPGTGGEKYVGSNGYSYGGGGGGVLVDGAGPREQSWDGEGYGGGEGGYNSGSPGSGLILLEIKPKL